MPDTNFVKHTSDSLINIALDYFEKQDDPVRRATALYYEGRVNQDLHNIMQRKQQIIIYERGM